MRCLWYKSRYCSTPLPCECMSSRAWQWTSRQGRNLPTGPPSPTSPSALHRAWADLRMDGYIGPSCIVHYIYVLYVHTPGKAIWCAHGNCDSILILVVVLMWFVTSGDCRSARKPFGGPHSARFLLQVSPHPFSQHLAIWQGATSAVHSKRRLTNTLPHTPEKCGLFNLPTGRAGTTHDCIIIISCYPWYTDDIISQRSIYLLLVSSLQWMYMN